MRALVSRVLAPLLLLAGCGGGDSGKLPFGLDPETPVILVVIDTLRADHLSCYGYDLETSPVIDALARKSYLFENNSTQCNSTFPSLTSILTGLYVKSHSNYLPVPVDGQSGSNEGAACLAQRFGLSGYHTIAAISHPFWANADPDAVALQGWDQRSVIGPPIPIAERQLYAHAQYTNERLSPMLDEYERTARDRPLFLWAHYFDPHTDLRGQIYNAPPETRNLFLQHHLDSIGRSDLFDSLAGLEPIDRGRWIKKNVEPREQRRNVLLANGRSLYDAEIRSCDAGIGRLFERLDEMGILEDAVVIIMADHGENMEAPRPGVGALAFSHKRLFEGVSHTPLIIKLPGQEVGQRIDALTENIDVAQTLMELLDLVPSPTIDGSSLIPLMAGTTDAIHEHVFTESSDQIEKSVKSTELKYVDRSEYGEAVVFDWRADPGELEDLAGKLDPARIAPLSEAMVEFRPIHSLRLRMTPADEPYTVSIQLDLPRSMVEQVVGAPESTIEQDGTRFSWTGTIAGEPVDLTLLLRRTATEMHWRITHDGEQDLPGAVYLGQEPIARTSAIPTWTATDQPAPENPEFRLARDLEAHTLTLDVPGIGERSIEAELRYRRPSYDKDLSLVEAQRFQQLEDGPSRTLRLATPVGGPASAVLRHSEEDAEVLCLLRIDGRWPDPRRISLDGRAVRGDVLEFLFPFPVDGRISSYLMTGHAQESTPPGSIVLWLVAGGGRPEIDTSRLDQEQIRMLEALGYLGGDEDDEDEDEDE